MNKSRVKLLCMSLLISLILCVPTFANEVPPALVTSLVIEDRLSEDIVGSSSQLNSDNLIQTLTEVSIQTVWGVTNISGGSLIYGANAEIYNTIPVIATVYVNFTVHEILPNGTEVYVVGSPIYPIIVQPNEYRLSPVFSFALVNSPAKYIVRYYASAIAPGFTFKPVSSSYPVNR